MRYEKKMTKYEKVEFQKKKLAHHLHGEGRYLYRNNTTGRLMLPKATLHNKHYVEKGDTFEGDGYFMQLVKSSRPGEKPLLRLVEVLEEPHKKEIPIMNEQKLILDQPPTVEFEGPVEHVIVNKNVPSKPVKKQKEVQPVNESPSISKDILLIEDPMNGVDILTD